MGTILGSPSSKVRFRFVATVHRVPPRHRATPTASERHPTMQTPQKRIQRREFLGITGAALSAPYIVPAGALSASDRLGATIGSS